MNRSLTWALSGWRTDLRQRCMRAAGCSQSAHVRASAAMSAMSLVLLLAAPTYPAGSAYISWANATRKPPSSPFELSASLEDVTYAEVGPANTSVPSCTGSYPPKTQCIGADTWYPTWGEGGDLFSTFTDGIAAGADGSYAHPLSCGQCSRSPRPKDTWVSQVI